jgi:hypothetical protein
MTCWVPARAGAALVGLCLLLGACGDGDFRDDAQDVAEATDDAVPQSEPDEDDDGDEAAPGGDGDEDGEDGAVGPGDQVVTLETVRATDGTWAILDAGTVTFRVVDDGLELLDVSPAAGWDASVEDDSDRKLTVELSTERRTYELRAERRGRDLRIVVTLDVDGAEPGPFTIGGAGTLRLDVDGDDLRAELDVTEGWTVRKEDHDDDEVEVELRSEDLRWRVAAEVDDGRIDIEADLRVEGRIDS